MLERPLQSQRLQRRPEKRHELRHSFSWRRRRQELLLRLDAEVDAGGKLEVEQRRLAARDVDVGPGRLGKLAEEGERPFRVVTLRRIVLVEDVLDGGGG